MSRTPIAAANWKLHKTSAEGRELAAAVCADAPGPDACEVVLCPPFTALPAVLNAVGNRPGVGVGGQNCYWETHGAYTGEVAAPMLAELGCTHVILGHSERRQYFGETDDTVAQRVQAALAAGLQAIVCIGETEAEREAVETETVLQRQLDGGVGGIPASEWSRIVLAYEPVWAIGTGRTATPEMANDAHRFIRQWIAAAVDGAVAAATRILYGGSVKPDNAAALFAESHIDGGLVGGASLDAEQFTAIVAALAAAPVSAS